MFNGKSSPIILSLILITGLLSACSKEPSPVTEKQISSNLHRSVLQVEHMLDTLQSSDVNPRSWENGRIQLVSSSDWTSGFFPGILWLLYEYNQDPELEAAADHYTMNLEQEKLNGRTHDMGFKLYTSFGNAYRLTGKEKYRSVLIRGANTLITRYNPVVGCIRSWDHNADKWDFPVIIDNMVNLELLFEATRITGDSVYYRIALSHAKKTLENHFRSDYSSYHVVTYDTLTGQVQKKATHQGYSDESAWSRGQAWGLYGFTMVFRETGDSIFLEQAVRIADYILHNPTLPDDMVPYWDFNDPAIPDAPRDASAAAIICSALYELSTFTEGEESDRFYSAADRILCSLSSPVYLAAQDENGFFILMHSVGNLPRQLEIDVPLVYADYYFIEANLRRLSGRDKKF